MKPDWDWKMMRRAASQIGVLIIVAGMVDASFGSRNLPVSVALVPAGIALIIFSSMRRWKMEPIVVVALSAAIPLIIILLVGLYLNR